MLKLQRKLCKKGKNMANINDKLNKASLAGAKLDIKNARADLASKNLNLGIKSEDDNHCKGWCKFSDPEHIKVTPPDEGHCKDNWCKFSDPEHIKSDSSSRTGRWILGDKKAFEFAGRGGLAMDDCPDYCKGDWCKFGGTHFKGSYTKDICGSDLKPSDFVSVSFTGTLTKELTKSLATLDCYIGKDRILVPSANLNAVKKVMK